MSRTTPVCDAVGTIEYWLGSFNDIDESKRTEQALRRSNERLEQFAYVAAHDLQEPLRNISISLSLLREQFGTRMTPDEAECLAESIKNARRMQGMVQDLLLYSRVISNNDQALPPVSARFAAEHALRNLEEALRESEAQVAIGDIPDVPVRESHLVMLFQSLVGNAIKYKKPGIQPVIQISASPKGSNWQFEVTDNGIGFDPAHADRIFKVFRRLHNRDEYTGNGIGLAVCARIVENYGGRIWAEGELGQGATFRFTLPAAEE